MSGNANRCCTQIGGCSMEGAFGDLIAALQRAEFEEKLDAITGQPIALRRIRSDDE